MKNFTKYRYKGKPAWLFSEVRDFLEKFGPSFANQTSIYKYLSKERKKSKSSSSFVKLRMKQLRKDNPNLGKKNGFAIIIVNPSAIWNICKKYRMVPPQGFIREFPEDTKSSKNLLKVSST